MPTRLCAHPRCPNPATYRGRCPTHTRTNNQRTHRNRHIYNSKRWKHLRRRVLFEQPICAHCNNALATDADHIQPIHHGGNPYARTNIQGLCHPCHSRKTRQEQQA